MSLAYDLPAGLTRGLSERELVHLRRGLRKARRDPFTHARAFHGWTPFEDQALFLRAIDIREGKVKRALKRAGRGYGKTKEIAELHLELAEAKPGIRTLASARSQEQSELSQKEMRAILFENEAAGSMLDPRGSKLSPYPVLKFKNGSEIHARSLEDGGLSLRGKEFDFVTADECAFLPETVWHFLVTLLRKSNGPLIGFSTPGEEWFDDLFTKYEDQRRDGDESVLAWAAPATLNPHLSADYFERARAEMPDVFYRREILAEPIGSSLHTFRKEHLEKIFDAGMAPSIPPVRGHRYGQGWDLAAEGAAVGLVADCTAPELVLGVHGEKHVRTVWPHVQRRVEETVRAYPGRKAIDWTGVGKASGQNLHVHVREDEQFVFTGPSRYELCVEGMKFVEDRAEKSFTSLALPTQGVWGRVRDLMRKHKLSMAKKRDSKSLGEISGETWDELDAVLLMIHAVNLSIRHRGSLVEAA